MATVQEFVGLLLFAGVLGALLGAAISATGQVLLGVSQSWVKSLENWWGSTAMATLIVSPFVLAWASKLPRCRAMIGQPKKLFEAAVLLAGLIATTWWILWEGSGIAFRNRSVLLLFLIWGGLRFGVRGATAINLGYSLFVEFCVRHSLWELGLGGAASRDYVLIMQVSLVVATMVGLIPAIVLAERDKTLKVLRESEDKFSKAFQASPDGIVISEQETGRLIEVNDSFCRLCGYSKEEAMGRTSLELGVFSSAADRERFVGCVRAAGRVKDYELRMRRRDGEIKTILLSAERIEIDGAPCLVIVGFDITARLQAEERLERTSRQLRALTRRLQSLREEERTRLAREIHDSLGQWLTALNLDLRLIERRAAGVADAGLRAALCGKITSARLLADEAITSVQKIAADLRPAILDRLGLEAAIESETLAFQTRTGVNCQWTLPSVPIPLEPAQATAVFRVFQEILTNVARHSQAGNLTVRLTQEDRVLILEVGDDGVGIQPGDIANPASLGLLGMKERVAIVGGKITFGPNAPRGTRVVVEIPLNGKAGQLG